MEGVDSQAQQAHTFYSTSPSSDIPLSWSPDVVHLGVPHAKASKLHAFALAFAVVLLGGFGNLSLAFGMKHAATVGLDPLDYLRAMLNPFVAGGIILLILWLLLRLALLSWADLSFATPITGVGYVLGAVLGKIFLAELISPTHWLATGLIFLGVGLVGSTTEKTTGRVS